MPLPAIEIEQDSVQPGIQTAAALELTAAAGHDQECFLGQIVGVPRIAGQHQRSTANPRNAGDWRY